jgi:hypothetical protein
MLTGSATVAIGRTRQGNARRKSSDTLRHLRGIADRVDCGIAGAKKLIDFNPPGLSEGYSCHFRKFGAGADPHREQHQIGLDALTAIGFDGAYAITIDAKGGKPRAHFRDHAMTMQL